MIQPSQLRRGAFSGTRTMAALALLFSFLAFLMAGVVMLRTGPEGGGLKANWQAFSEEASKVVADLRSRIGGGKGSGSSNGADSGTGTESATTDPGDGPRSVVPNEDDESGGLELDAIKERVDEIEDKVLADDKTAGDYIDKLKEDLAGLEDLTKNKGGPLLDEIGEALSEARKTLAEDSTEAARRLRLLSDDLVKRSREQTRRLTSEPKSDPTPDEAPDSAE